MQTHNTFNHITKITAFALPISAGMLINMLSSFIAITFVAKLGKVTLAAAALATPTFTTILTIFACIFYALGILISHYRAQNKPDAAIGELIKNGFWLAIFLSLPAFLILSHMDKVLLLFKQDPALVALTPRYFFYAGLTMIPTLIGGVLAQTFIGIGKPRFMMLASLITLPIMVILSYGLILGYFGLPKMALAGVSCASFIVQSLACLGIIFYMRNNKQIATYEIFTGNFRPNWTLCKTSFLLGLPIGIQFGAELAALAISTYFMGYFGVEALAASQISSQYSVLVVMVTLGISQAVSILTSEAYGKQDYALVKNYLFSALTVLTLFFMVVLTVFLLAPQFLIQPFVNLNNFNNLALIHLAIKLLAIAGIIQFIDGIRNILSATLRGLHISKIPMQIGVLCLWLVSLPACYLAGFNLHGGPVGLRLGFMTGFIVAVILLCLQLRKKLSLLIIPMCQRIML